MYEKEELEQIISSAFVLLKDGKTEEARNLLEESHHKINEYYERKFGGYTAVSNYRKQHGRTK